ncbi:MAG: hypothetical protein EBQ94_06140 [Flavobacteriales bacterium]|nr:hypothetical protein [Crocinitomicaceae bacterium]NBX79949.1 hypothetical protein [Flavobacteriales bacterium]
MSNLKFKTATWIFIPLIILVYWQISFCTAALKWDLLDVVFPFRYHFSSSVMSGHFPLWNPYIQTGVPYYADLQAPTYYPELIFVSSLGGYTIYWMHFLVITYLIVGFFGLFKLLKFFNYSDWSASIPAFIYVCSGYFIGHGQHFFLLVGSAWLPWVIWAYLRFIDNTNKQTAITFILFTFLMLTGAYQALSICLFYLLLILFLSKTYTLFSENRKKMIQFFAWNFAVVLILIAMLSPMLLAIFEASTQVSRLKAGVSWEKTAEYGESFKSLLSFIAPLSTARSNDFFGKIDASMLNHFIGVIGLFFGIYGWNSKRSKREWLLLIFGLMIGAMSFSELPVRKILFDYVPFMNLFLQGPYLRVFMILGLLVFIAGGIEKWNLQKTISYKEVLFPILIIVPVFSLVAYHWASFDFNHFFRDWLISSDWLAGWKQFKFQQLLGFQLILSILILSLLVLILLLSSKLKHPKFWISFLIFLELFLAAQWNQSETYVDRSNKPSYLHKNIQLNPKGFPIPHLIPIAFNDEQHAFILPFWRNTYIFQKEISFNAFSSFELDNFSYLDDVDANLKNWALKNPLIYLSDKVLPLSKFASSLKNNDLDPRTVFVESSELYSFEGFDFSSNKRDNLKIVGFSPNAIRIQTETKKQQLLILQQSFQKDWKARIDGKMTEIIRVNKNYQAIILPAGKHIVSFKFEKNSILLLYFLSQFLFWSLLVYLIYLRLKSTNRSKWYAKILFIFPFVFVACWALKFHNDTLNKRSTNQQILSDWSQRTPVKKVLLPQLINITSKDEFFNLGKWKLEDVKNASTLRLQADCKMDSIQPSLIIYQIIRKGESVKWEACKIERQLERQGEYNTFLFMRNLSDLQQDDEIILYGWNISKSSIQFKNSRIEFLE